MSAAERKAAEIKAGREARSQYSPSALVDKARVHRLKKEATTSGANKAVLAEVRKNTGMKQSDIDPKAMGKYREALAAKLKGMGMPEKNAKIAAKQLSKKRPNQLRDELSKAKYGKKYSELKDGGVEQKTIKKMNSELRTLSKDSDKARTFRKAYVDAYAGRKCNILLTE